MGSPNQLSVVAEFDDLRRNRRVLTQGNETEFLRFVRSHDEWRRGLANAEDDKQQLKEKLNKVESAHKTLELQLRHARSQLDSEIRKRKLAEQDRHSLEQQIALIRELLSDKQRNGQLDERDRQRLEFINSDYQVSQQFDSPKNRNLTAIEESVSLLSDCDISYDKTEEDLEVTYLRSGRRWQRSQYGAPDDADQQGECDHTERISPERKKKRQSSRRRHHRRSRSAGAVITTKLSLAEPIDEGSPTPKHRRSASGGRRPMRKCNSATGAGSSSYDDLYQKSLSAQSPQKKLKELNRQVTPPSGLRLTNSNNNLRRPHIFTPRTCIKPGESCNPCGKRFGFGRGVYKCTECRAVCHEKCKDDLPLPCIPIIATPNKNTKGLLAEYAPPERPSIPALVVHCVQEVENRGLEEKGIYRVPGAEREVRELRDRFNRGRAPPNLSKQNVPDINVICGCLKGFLKDLKEPLLTAELWQDFVSAATMKDRDEAYTVLYQAVSKLPHANRDTLAYLVLHLQRVAESPLTLMKTSNLSTVFGPTLVGYSKIDMAPEQMIHEAGLVKKVVESLMNLTPDYWERMLNVTAEVSLYPNITATPETMDRDRGSIYQSMLGPVISTTPTGTPMSTPANSTAMNDTRRGWFTTPGRSRADQRTFFSSPTV